MHRFQKANSDMAMEETVLIKELHEKQGMQERKTSEIYTRDGSKDWNGHPAVKARSGGWRVGILVLVNQGLATLAFYGVGVNLVLFLTRVLKLDNAEAANHVSNWTGTAYVCSIVGAFVSDSYWGRYKTSAVFQIIFVSGLVELSLSTCLFLLKPCVPGDGKANCEPPTSLEILVFYLSIYQIALGNGGYQPVIATFGADQFSEDDPEEERSKVAFFSYFYMANNLGTLFSNTALAYLEDEGKWVLGFWISTGAAFLAMAVFFTGNARYRHFKPGGNIVTRMSQVVVAALMKWKVSVPPHDDDLYEIDGQHQAISSRKILHTPDFRFLDKAAVVTSEDFPLQDHTQGRNPWTLCTITQVEEVKCIIRLLPIWLCTIIYSVVYNQMNSVFIEQGAAMRTSLSTFDIPPASMSIFEILSVVATILLYRLYVVPFLARILQGGNPEGLTQLQRMGVGIFVSAAAMVVAGVVEMERLKHGGNVCDACNKGSSSISILWQVPQYVLVGVSEVFMYVSQLEFFNNQTPDGLKSFGSALYVASMSAGSYLSSLLVMMVMGISGKGDRIGWISENLNRGHMDRFYFLLAALAVVDLVFFVACAKRHRCILLESKVEAEEEDHGEF